MSHRDRFVTGLQRHRFPDLCGSNHDMVASIIIVLACVVLGGLGSLKGSFIGSLSPGLFRVAVVTGFRMAPSSRVRSLYW